MVMGVGLVSWHDNRVDWTVNFVQTAFKNKIKNAATLNF